MSRSMLVLCLLTLITVSSAQAQGISTDLVPGRRIRVQQHQGTMVQGALVSVSDTALTLRTSETDTVVVARAAIAKVEVYEGTKSKAGKGAVTGLLIGGGIGVVLGVATASSTEGTLLESSPGSYAVGSGLLFGALGAGVGALIGSGSHTEKWQSVVLPAVLPTVTILPDESKGRRVALGLRISF